MNTMSAVQYLPFIKINRNGNNEIELTVKGIHCSSCMKKIENTLYNDPKVNYARVNLTTETIRFSWKGKKEHSSYLVSLITNLGYTVFIPNENNIKHDEKELKFLLRCIAISLFGSANIMAISIVLWTTTASSIGQETKNLFQWISLIIAVPMIIYSAQPFFKSSITILLNKKTNMDVPIALAILLTTIMSIYETINRGEHIYFDSALMLISFLLIGRYLDKRSRGKARRTAQQLLSKLDGVAKILIQNKIKEIPINQIKKNMIVIVNAGDNIPADGKICKGETNIDISLITGESMPQLAGNEDKVFAGTTNLTQTIHIQVTADTKQNLLSEIIKIMETAQQGHSTFVRIADRASTLYIPVVHSLALLTFLGWIFIGGHSWQMSLMNAVTVLIITCPCALGLAVPVVQILGSQKLMKKGILLKSSDALEKINSTTSIVFDKTGTLTYGEPKLINKPINKHIFTIAASLAGHSNHPLSKALYKEFDNQIIPMTDIKEIIGKGIQGYIGSKLIKLGNNKFCNAKCINDSKNINLFLNIDNQHVYTFQFQDQLRSDTNKIIQTLRKLKFNIVLLSGDTESIVAKMANKLNIEKYKSHMSPIDKKNYIENLQSRKETVLMVGDGLNDAPSLSIADSSISHSKAIDITQNTADIVFQGELLEPVLEIIQTAKNVSDLVKQNFSIAVVYNFIAIPIAVSGMVTPLFAAIAMSSSSLIVLANSFRINLK